MAQTQTTAKLGLVITAKDEARQVFQEFARNLSDDMKKIQESIKQAFNMEKAVTNVQEATAKINESFSTIKDENLITSMKKAQEDTQTAMKSVVEATNKMKNDVGNDMQQVAEKTTTAMDSVRTKASEASSGVKESFGQIKTSMDNLGHDESLKNVETNLKTITSEANQMASTVSSDFKRVGNEATTMGERVSRAAHAFQFGEIQNVGMQMEMLGHHVNGFFLDAVKSAADFDQGIVNTTASLDANRGSVKLSKNEIDAMRRSAIDMGYDGFFSANQIAEAMNVMAKQGLSYQQIMHGGIQTTKQVAAANQQDLQQTANVISDIYNEMGDGFRKSGVSANEAALQIGNGMTVAMHHANISMDDFMNTMKYVGPQASALGVDFRDVATSIAILGQHGIKGSQAGTALRRELTNLIPQSKDAKKAMDALGLTSGQVADAFFDASGKMLPLDQVQAHLHDTLSGLNPKMQEMAIKAIFGQYALAGMTAVVKTAPEDFKKLRGEMNNNNLMTEIMNEKSQGLGMQIAKLNAHWETMKKEIGDALKPVILTLIATLNVLMAHFHNLSEPVKKMIVYFGAISGVVLTVGGALLFLLGTVGMFISSAAVAVEGLATLGGALSAIAGPVAVVIGVVVAMAYAWKHNLGGIQQEVHKFVNWFKPVFMDTMKKATADVQAGIKAITGHFHKMAPDIKKAVDGVIKFLAPQFAQGMMAVTKTVSQGVLAVTGWFKKMAPEFNKAMSQLMKFFTSNSATWKTLWEVFKFIVKFAWDWIVGIVQHAWGIFSGVIQLFTHIINGEWKKAFTDLWQIVKNAFLLALDLLGGFVGKGAGWFAKFIEHTNIFGKGFSKIISTVFKEFGKITEEGWRFAEKIFTSGVKVLTSIFKGWYEVITNILSAVLRLFQGKPREAMSALETAIRAGVSAAGNALKGILSIADTVLGGLPSKMLNWGKNAVNMFAEGIKSGISAVGGAITGVMDKIKSLAGFHSPTKEGPASESDVWFPNMMKMFQKGIDDNKDKIKNSVMGVMVGVQSTVSGTQDHIHKVMNSSSQHGSHVIRTNNRNNQQTVVNINIDGRSAQADKQLAEQIARQFRTQMTMVM